MKGLEPKFWSSSSRLDEREKKKRDSEKSPIAGIFRLDQHFCRFFVVLMLFSSVFSLCAIYPAQAAETFGAEASNPTGNPIGGGAGYTDIITQNDPRVKFIVHDKAELRNALQNAKAGDIVYIPGDVSIDMTGEYFGFTVSSGVTVASDRGLNGSPGGRLFLNRLNDPWASGQCILKTGGDNVRITGLRLEGPDKGTERIYESGQFVKIGIKTQHKNMIVDNCELWGFSYTAIFVQYSPHDYVAHIHHNYIHTCQTYGYGYGVLNNGGTVLVEANKFDYVRHMTTDPGDPGHYWEIRYNIFGPNAISQQIDTHYNMGYPTTPVYIHHNTFLHNGDRPNIELSGTTSRTSYIDHNIFARTTNSIYLARGEENLITERNYVSGGAKFLNTHADHLAAGATRYLYESYIPPLGLSTTPRPAMLPALKMPYDSPTPTPTPTPDDMIGDVLFVVRNGALNSGDAAVKQHLEGMGFGVITVYDDQCSVADAEGIELIIVSTSCRADYVADTFRDVAVPFITWESWLYDDMKMTGAVINSDYGAVADQTKVAITWPEHPMAAGLIGSTTVFTIPSYTFYGSAENSAYQIATVVGDSSKCTIFGYHTGAPMVGMYAPAPRVGLFLSDISAATLTEQGWALFEAAVTWALDSIPEPVPEPPQAAFSAPVTSGSAPLTVSYTDKSTNSPKSWKWDFGDGMTSTEQNPKYTYKAEGSYSVTLTVTNDAGSDTLEKSDYIKVSTGDPTIEAPVAEFTADVTGGTAPLLVKFIDYSTNNPTGWFWDFGDGSTSTSENPSHLFDAGIFTVSLTASNAGGSDTITKVNYITVLQDSGNAPVADFSYHHPGEKVGTKVRFTDLSYDTDGVIVGWLWDFGDGAKSTSQKPLHVFGSPGTYQVKLIVTDDEGYQSGAAIQELKVI